MVIDLIKLNSAANNIYFNLMTKAGKVIEVVGVLLGFIVIAVVQINFENCVSVSSYLNDGFSITLFFLTMSISLGLYVCLDTNAYYAIDNKLDETDLKKVISHLNKLRVILNASILFCLLGLFSVTVVLLLIFNSFQFVLKFVLFSFLIILLLYFLTLDGESESK